MNANNAAGGAAPAGGGAPPVAPAYPPLVVEAKPHYFVIGANLPPPFEVDPLGTKTTPHAPRVTSLNGPVPKEARIIGIHVEGRYVDSRQTDPLEFRSLLKSRAVHRKIHFIMVTRTPRPIGATEATLRAYDEEFHQKMTDAMLEFETKPVEPCYHPSHMPYLQQLKQMVFHGDPTAVPPFPSLLANLPSPAPATILPSYHTDGEYRKAFERCMLSRSTFVEDLFSYYCAIHRDIETAADRRKMTRSIAALKLFLERVLTHKIDTGHTKAVTTVEWSADDDEDGDDETAKMVEAEKAKAKPLIDKIHQTAVAEADNAAAGSSPNSNSNGTSSTSTAVTTTMTREEMQELARRIARERVDAKKAKKLERARRIAAKEAKAMEVQAKTKAEEVEAQEIEAKAKAKAFVDGIYQAAVAKAADAVTGSSPSSNRSSSNGTRSTSTAVTTTTRSGIGRDDGDSTSMDTARTDQLELAWRIAAERVQAETEEAKAKAIVDGYVQAAIARAWTDIGLKKSHEKTSQARKTMDTVEDAQAPRRS